MRAFLLLAAALTLVALSAVPLFVYNTIRAGSKRERERYVTLIAIALDQLVGSLGYRTEDYTVSAWTHHLCRDLGRKCWLERLIDRIFYAGHCRDSWEREQRGKV
jgi:hypothetical protein